MVGFSIGGSANSASPSGTSIPVKKGGTGATTAAGALENLLPSFTGNDGKVLGLNSGTPQWVAQTGGGNSAYMFPDYANMEGTPNLMSSTTSEYIADRAGYIYLSIYVKGTSSNSRFSVRINGRSVLVNGNKSVNEYVEVDNIFAVNVGDKVTYSFQNGFDITSLACYFIPPKYSTPPTPIVVEGGDYSTTEQAVMVNENGNLRPKLWVDGKPIYQQTFTGTITANANANVTNVQFAVSDIDVVIDYSGYWERSAGGQQYPLQITDGQADGSLKQYSMVFYEKASSYIGFNSYSTVQRTDAKVVITIQYTKTD
ncbi:MAG: hypothetical protein LBK50_03380 [Candidatus Nomurabacteria bacterium]|nr:hypothetical protein [Candidatus Nomurabacteria bacterium]